MRWLLVVVALVGCGDNEFVVDAAVMIDAADCGGPVGVLQAPCSPPPRAQLSITPATVDLGSTGVGVATTPSELVVSNEGGESSGAIAIQLTGSMSANFAIAENTCTTLVPGASCTVSVVCRPMTVGAKFAKVVVTSSPGGSENANLDCVALTGCGPFISPSSSAFGSIEIGGASGTSTFTVLNGCASPSGPLQTVLAGQNPNDFEIVNDTCQGATIAAGASCTIEARFAPNILGALSATLQMSDGTSATLAGTSVAVANIERSPLLHDFGNLNPGHASASRTVTMESGSTATTLTANGLASK